MDSIIMKQQEEIINVIISLMPGNEEHDVELSVYTTGSEIKSALIDNGLIRKASNSGDPYSYSIVVLSSNIQLSENKSLLDIGVKDGDILIITHELVAGISSGNMIFTIPEKFEIGEKSKSTVRIARKDLKEFILSEGLNSNQANEIEINDLMIVKLEENSINNHLYINPLNTEEQIISDSYYSEWNFEIIPQRIGFTSIMLKIVMPLILEGFGEKHKDVFLINKDIEVTKNPEIHSNNYINKFENIYQWTDKFRAEIYQFIGNNETGKALSKLVNFFQKCDLELLNAMIIFQSQWNEGRNKSLLNIVSQNEWMMIQTKINYGILEIIKNIEYKKMGNQDNLPIINRLGNQIKGIL